MSDDAQDDSTRSAVSESIRDIRDEEHAARKRRAAAAKVAAAELKLRVFALRRAGASFRAIARETGMSVGRCHQIVDGELKVLEAQLSHSREHLRALELERCDALLVKLDGFLREGRKVERTKNRDGETIETVVHMKRPSVGYFFAYMRVMERRAKLLGIDAPTKVEVTEPKPERALPDDVLGRRIAELQAETADADERLAKGSVH